MMVKFVKTTINIIDKIIKVRVILMADIHKVKSNIVDKVSEMFDCVAKIGKQDFFEIHLKIVNGEVITKVEFSDKDKIR